MRTQLMPYAERLSLTLLLPRSLLIGQVVLIGVFSMMIMIVVWLIRYDSPPHNPFAAYADIFPGETNRTLAAHGFECRGENYNYAQHTSEGFCSLFLKSSAFYRITVTYANGVIRTVHFEIRDEVIGLGDLTTLLDATQLSPKFPITFHWRKGIGVAGVSKLHNPHFFTGRHVWQVRLMDNDLRMP